MRLSNVTLGNCQKIWNGYFSELNAETKKEVENQTVFCTYENACRLNMEDFISGRRIWKIKKGVLHVIMHGNSGKTLVLFKITPDNSGFVLPDGFFDLMILNMEFVTVADTEICYLPENLSRQIYRECESVKYWQSQQHLKIFSKLLEAINDLSFLSLQERLEKWLSECCVQNQTDIVHMTHEQLACELGTSREVISRLLKKMEIEQVIKIERKSIRVLRMFHNHSENAQMVG